MFLSVGKLGNIFVRNIGHVVALFVANLQLCAYLIGKPIFLLWKDWENVGKLRKIVSATKMFLDLFGNIFASREGKFCFCNNVSRGGKTGNLIRNIMFPRQCFLVCPEL